LLASAVAGADSPLFVELPYHLDPDERDKLHLAMPAGAAEGLDQVGPGDRVAIIDGSQVVSAGAVVTAAGGQAAARLDWLEWQLPATGTAWVIPADLPRRLASTLPPCIRQQVESTTGPPASPPASSAGMGGAAGHLSVAAVSPGGEGVRLEARQDPRRPAAVGDRLDLYRGPSYVGFARVIAVDSASLQAELLTALSRSAVHPGDVAVPRRTETESPTCGRAFRKEGDYFLVSLGEMDGVNRGDVLFARTARGTDYRLRVDRVYPQHCGATVETPDLAEAAATWDCACRHRAPLAFAAIPPGCWRSTGVDWLAIVERDAVGQGFRAGDVLALQGRTLGVGVVLHVDRECVYVFVPGVWDVVPEWQEGQQHGAEP